MKIRQVVLSFLLVGILGSTLAEDQTVTQNAPNSNSASSEEECEPAESLLCITKAKCRHYGGPTAFEDSNIVGSPYAFVSCVQEFINLTQFQEEIVQARNENKGPDTVIDQYCPKVPALQQCVKNVTGPLGLCLAPQERTSLDILYRIGKSMLTFACSGGKQKVADFLISGGSTCVATKYRAMQRCFSTSFPKRTYDSMLVYIPGVGMVPDLNLDVTGCNNIDQFRNCTVGVLEECENPTIGKVIGGLFDFVKNETTCTQIIRDNSNTTV